MSLPIPSETLPVFPDDELLNNVISSFSSSSSENDVVLPLTPLNPDNPNNINIKQIDDSRKLFQRLWTDNDEIHLLRSFLNYSNSRGNVHHHDSTAFYDQVKNDFQVEFNKNQLVEKLRRLKKKCRTVLSRIHSGHEFLFKSSHDQETFELSRRIWFSNRGDGSVQFDDNSQNPNPNLSGGGLEKLSARKRQKVVEKVEDGVFVSNDNDDDNDNDNVNGSVNDNDNVVNNVGPNAGGSVPLQGLVEEALRNCISSVLKGVVNGVLNDASNDKSKGISRLSNVDGKKDENWKKQQIMELEVYSKRLELVQDKIKLSLEELRSKESGGIEIDSMEVE